jgi:hypothetical protein
VSTPGARTGCGGRARAVAIGGGHGLARTLRRCRVVDHVTAVVTVADDGGSSGRLRATSTSCRPGTCGWRSRRWRRDPRARRGARYRFDRGELAGHSLGNLVLVALQDLAAATWSRRSTELARCSGCRVGSCRARPSRHAARQTGRRGVTGQAAVAATPGCERVWLEPARPGATRSGRGDRARRPGRARARVAVHEPAAEPARAGDRRALAAAAAPSCWSPTCASSPARPRAWTSPTTSTRSRPRPGGAPRRARRPRRRPPERGRARRWTRRPDGSRSASVGCVHRRPARRRRTATTRRAGHARSATAAAPADGTAERVAPASPRRSARSWRGCRSGTGPRRSAPSWPALLRFAGTLTVAGRVATARGRSRSRRSRARWPGGRSPCCSTATASARAAVRAPGGPPRPPTAWVGRRAAVGRDLGVLDAHGRPTRAVPPALCGRSARLPAGRAARGRVGVSAPGAPRTWRSRSPRRDRRGARRARPGASAGAGRWGEGPRAASCQVGRARSASCWPRRRHRAFLRLGGASAAPAAAQRGEPAGQRRRRQPAPHDRRGGGQVAAVETASRRRLGRRSTTTCARSRWRGWPTRRRPRRARRAVDPPVGKSAVHRRLRGSRRSARSEGEARGPRDRPPGPLGVGRARVHGRPAGSPGAAGWRSPPTPPTAWGRPGPPPRPPRPAGPPPTGSTPHVPARRHQRLRPHRPQLAARRQEAGHRPRHRRGQRPHRHRRRWRCC